MGREARRKEEIAEASLQHAVAATALAETAVSIIASLYRLVTADQIELPADLRAGCEAILAQQDRLSDVRASLEARRDSFRGR